jgi:hypothetical protein
LSRTGNDAGVPEESPGNECNLTSADRSFRIAASYIKGLFALRAVFNQLAWLEQVRQLARLIRREDIPRAPQRVPLSSQALKKLSPERV